MFSAVLETTGQIRDAVAVDQGPRAGLSNRGRNARRYQGPELVAETAQRIVESFNATGGDVERTLRALGVTDIHLLRRGAEIDRAAEQLIADASAAQLDLHEMGHARSVEVGVAEAADWSGSQPPPTSGSEKAAGLPDSKFSAQSQALQAEP